MQRIILAYEARGHRKLEEEGQGEGHVRKLLQGEGHERKLLQPGQQTRAREGPQGGTPGGLTHMAVVGIGSSQQFEVVRIIFRTYSYPKLSEISIRLFRFCFGKLTLR